MHHLEVIGDVATQGSKRLVRLRNGRTAMLEASRRIRPWRQAVAEAAMAHGIPMFTGDVTLEIVARWVRPASHYRKDGTLRGNLPQRPGYADCDKVARGVCDALAGIAYANDRQVAVLRVERRWCEPGQPPGAGIDIGGIVKS